MKRKFSAIVLLLFSGFTLMAQTSTQGKEFWLSFMKNGFRYNNGNTWVDNNVMISAKRDCTGTITNPLTGWSESFTVEANRVKFLDIPEIEGYNSMDEYVAYKGLKVVTSDTVSLYISSCATNSFDASFVLPIESLGSEYIIQTDAQSDIPVHPDIEDQYTSAFLIVALENNTTVEITPTVKTIGGHAAGQTFSLNLHAGQSYSVRSHYGNGSRDLSGSIVKCVNGKKIAVFNGNTLTTIPNISNGGSDHIFEQALPTFSWGRHFVVTSSNGRARDFVKITSSANGNTVKKNGQPLTTLNKGESYVFDLRGWDGSCYVETSQPSMVYLYNTTYRDAQESPDNRTGDPSMVWIPPVELKIDEITFCTFNHYEATIDNHYVNIVVERKDIRRVYFDGTPIDPSQFQPVQGNPNFCFTRKWIVPGIHHLQCRMGLMAHVYGFGEVKGYAYCVGSNIIDLRSQLYINDTPSELLKDGYFACIDDTLRFEVETNYSINQVSWDFGDNHQGQGESTIHVYPQSGDYAVLAHIEGFNTFNQQPVSEIKSVMVHVGEPEVHDTTLVLCDIDTFSYYGVEYTQSGYYERIWTNIFGCDSSFYLNLDLNFRPDFEIEGEQHPIGGSETHIGIYDYAIRLNDPRTQIDTVLWQVDCPNWRIEPHGKGETCTLFIHTISLEPVQLHATVINRCATKQQALAIQTTYYDLPQHEEQPCFEVAPNPTSGELILHFGNLTGLAEIEVFNTLGQKVDDFTLDTDNGKKTYIMPKLNNGIYFLVMKNKGTTMTRKVALVR